MGVWGGEWGFGVANGDGFGGMGDGTPLGMGAFGNLTHTSTKTFEPLETFYIDNSFLWFYNTGKRR
jgi:hypothetical protein